MPPLILLLLLLLIGLSHELHCLSVVELVPKTIRTHYDEIMIIHFETSDFWFVYDDAVFGILSLEVSKSASSGQPAREDPQWASDGVVEAIRHFSYSGSLVDLASGFNDTLLLISIAGLVVLSHLIALIELITGEDGARIS